MVEVKIDKARNLVVVTFAGHVDRAQAQQKLYKVAAALEGMKPGFRLLTDLSGLDSMEYDCAPAISATMDLFRKKGVAEVVRVVPDPHKDIGFKVMSLFHYGRKVPVLTCETRAEALEKLSA
jgi:anti-anti-sigma regulatory factor